MISNTISRAACLAELTSNPKSFFNCPDMHGGSQGARPSGRGYQLSVISYQREKSEEGRAKNGEQRTEDRKDH